MKPSERLVQRLKDQQEKPIPRWVFKARNTALWAGFAMATLLGGLAFSVVLFAIQQSDFNMLSHMSHSRMERFLAMLPILWLGFLAVFLVLAMYSVQYAPKGYKLTWVRLGGYSAGLSFVVGTLFFIAGGAQQLEGAFAVRVTLYESIQQKKIDLWSMPDEGYLSGEIIETGLTSLRLRDFTGKVWTITHQGAVVPPVVLMERGEAIKLIGTRMTEDAFRAEEIRPWGGRGGPGTKRRDRPG